MHVPDRVDSAGIVSKQGILFGHCEISHDRLEAAVDCSEVRANAIDREITREHATVDTEEIDGRKNDCVIG